ncbi:probable G-protein coupled receptor 160 [Spea bombifrons]|uniref:probable G-protein coupled receptor 160 n=1 Tax=Spea bombifrons TaxID=233779 RepID=UPI002348EF95|nr:probable G-protein coupled receptor 160 [Spea bombifrons]XP_053315338.1 probable G-protein coupled receptor 160 [Spea bombifrons]XP_053315339.1 probable G-protein coupled receptor 160 [Spea bombifrons]
MTKDIVFISLSEEDMSALDTMNGRELLEGDTRTQVLEPSCILILIISGKIVMNMFVFGARQRSVCSSFLGYFCISLALVDFLLLVMISGIHYFQDFALWGVRFTNYHICLLTQIVSHVYGILHYPVVVSAALDYYLTILRSVKLPRICSGLLYPALVLLLWMAASFYVLNSPVGYSKLDAGITTYQCTFYISKQSFYLSAAVVSTVFLVLLFCCFEVVTFVKSLKISTYIQKTVILFSYGTEWPIRGTKRLMTVILFSFLGTWAPLVILQMIILILCSHIPGYMDMNIPWLFFLNSFLLGIFYGIKYPDLLLTEKIILMDPFINWKYSFLAFIDIGQSNGDGSVTEPSPKCLLV